VLECSGLLPRPVFRATAAVGIVTLQAAKDLQAAVLAALAWAGLVLPDILILPV
jgi:hypothetical protein